MERSPRSSEFTMRVDSSPVPVVHLRGWLDHWATRRFRTEASHLLLDGPRSIVLECGELDGIDAAGLRAVLDLRRHLPTDGELVVVGASPLFRRLLALTGIDRHVHLVEVQGDPVLDVAGPASEPPVVDLGIGHPVHHARGEGPVPRLRTA